MQSVRDLKIVRELCEQRSFARASEALGMSQPALSRALVRIEHQMGVKLFERSRTAVVPTSYAEIVLQRCDPLIAGFEDIARATEAGRRQDAQGFAVAVGPFVAEAVGLAAFAAHAAARRRPTGRMVVRDWRTCLEELQAGRCDLAITDVPSAREHADLEGEELFDAPMVIFCSAAHALARNNDPDLSDLMRHPWAAPLMQGRYLAHLPRDLGAAGRIDPETGDFVPAICVDSFAAMTAAVRGGRAISAAPPAFIRDELARGEFVALPFREPWMRMSYGLIWRRDQPWSRGLSEFVATLKEVQASVDPDPVPPGNTAGQATAPDRI
jgi:DNA-binding transcriptional LysR family regulator